MIQMYYQQVTQVKYLHQVVQVPAPQWVNSAPAGAIEGITIRDESSIVGTANSISTINFIGSVVTADAAAGAGIATVTVNAIAGLGVSEGSGSKVGTATGLDFVGSLVRC